MSQVLIKVLYAEFICLQIKNQSIKIAKRNYELLKFVSAIFYHFFPPPNDSPPKTIKHVFYLM